MTVTVDVHKLWSGTCASPNAGHFSHLAFRLEPDAPARLPSPRFLKTRILPWLNCPTSRSFWPSPSRSAQQGAA